MGNHKIVSAAAIATTALLAIPKTRHAIAVSVKLLAAAMADSMRPIAQKFWELIPIVIWFF